MDYGFFKDGYAPPTAFFFSVKFLKYGDMESSFQEVSGLKVTVKVTEKKEGGDNYFIHYLPNPPVFQDLVLKRCLLPNQSLTDWCKKALEDFKFEPLDLQIILLGPNRENMASWTVSHAFPISWELSPLNSTKNELAIETLTLKYKRFVKDSNS
ncbi:phage tail protein [Algoriphagus aestuarii]|nr:phage tail protein [Algoriphagus aestuarii]